MCSAFGSRLIAGVTSRDEPMTINVARPPAVSCCSHRHAVRLGLRPSFALSGKDRVRACSASSCAAERGLATSPGRRFRAGFELQRQGAHHPRRPKRGAAARRHAHARSAAMPTCMRPYKAGRTTIGVLLPRRRCGEHFALRRPGRTRRCRVPGAHCRPARWTTPARRWRRRPSARTRSASRPFARSSSAVPRGCSASTPPRVHRPVDRGAPAASSMVADPALRRTSGGTHRLATIAPVQQHEPAGRRRIAPPRGTTDPEYVLLGRSTSAAPRFSRVQRALARFLQQVATHAMMVPLIAGWRRLLGTLDGASPQIRTNISNACQRDGGGGRDPVRRTARVDIGTDHGARCRSSPVARAQGRSHHLPAATTCGRPTSARPPTCAAVLKGLLRDHVRSRRALASHLPDSVSSGANTRQLRLTLPGYREATCTTTPTIQVYRFRCTRRNRFPAGGLPNTTSPNLSGRTVKLVMELSRTFVARFFTLEAPDPRGRTSSSPVRIVTSAGALGTCCMSFRRFRRWRDHSEPSLEEYVAHMRVPARGIADGRIVGFVPTVRLPGRTISESTARLRHLSASRSRAGRDNIAPRSLCDDHSSASTLTSSNVRLTSVHHTRRVPLQLTARSPAVAGHEVVEGEKYAAGDRLSSLRRRPRPQGGSRFQNSWFGSRSDCCRLVWGGSVLS